MIDPNDDDLYDEVVQFLQEATALWDRSGLPDRKPPEEQQEEKERAYRVSRRLEDVALLAVKDVASKCGPCRAREAIMDAGAWWLINALIRRVAPVAAQECRSTDWRSIGLASDDGNGGTP